MYAKSFLNSRWHKREPEPSLRMQLTNWAAKNLDLNKHIARLLDNIAIESYPENGMERWGRRIAKIGVVSTYTSLGIGTLVSLAYIRRVPSWIYKAGAVGIVGFGAYKAVRWYQNLDSWKKKKFREEKLVPYLAAAAILTGLIPYPAFVPSWASKLLRVGFIGGAIAGTGLWYSKLEWAYDKDKARKLLLAIGAIPLLAGVYAGVLIGIPYLGYRYLKGRSFWGSSKLLWGAGIVTAILPRKIEQRLVILSGLSTALLGLGGMAGGVALALKGHKKNKLYKDYKKFERVDNYPGNSLKLPRGLAHVGDFIRSLDLSRIGWLTIKTPLDAKGAKALAKKLEGTGICNVILIMEEEAVKAFSQAYAPKDDGVIRVHVQHVEPIAKEQFRLLKGIDFYFKKIEII